MSKALALNLGLFSFCFFSLGCSLSYIANSGLEQSRLLLKRQPIKKVLLKKNLSQKLKSKLKLVEEVKEFSESHLGLKQTKNYSSYVDVHRPYLTWLLRAAHTDSLTPYEWWFPIIGKVPYKGYFKKEEALRAQKKFDPKKYDTYVRGVSAYSTLGWFNDPVVSTMLKYKDHNLVNLIIHESVHASIYKKSHTDLHP